MSKTLDRLRRRGQQISEQEESAHVEPSIAPERESDDALPPAPDMTQGVVQSLRRELDVEKQLNARASAEAEARRNELEQTVSELKSHSTALSTKVAELTEQIEVKEEAIRSADRQFRETESRLTRRITEMEKDAQSVARRIAGLSEENERLRNPPLPEARGSAGPQKQETASLLAQLPPLLVDDSAEISEKLKKAEDRRQQLEETLASREKTLGRTIADMESNIRNLTKELETSKEKSRAKVAEHHEPRPAPAGRNGILAVVVIGAAVVGAVAGRFFSPAPPATTPDARPAVSQPVPAPPAMAALKPVPVVPPADKPVQTTPTPAPVPQAAPPEAQKLPEPAVESPAQQSLPVSTAPSAPVVMQQAPEPAEPAPWPEIRVPGVTSSVADDVCTIVFQDGIFSYLAILRPDARNVLLQVADSLRDSAMAFSLVVEGHTDQQTLSSNSPYSNNYELGMARAKMVVDFFERQGKLPKAFMTPASVGESNPPFSNDTPDSQRRNRTVVLKLLRASGAVQHGESP